MGNDFGAVVATARRTRGAPRAQRYDDAEKLVTRDICDCAREVSLLFKTGFISKRALAPLNDDDESVHLIFFRFENFFFSVSLFLRVHSLQQVLLLLNLYRSRS